MTNYTVKIDSFSRVLNKVSSNLPKGIEPPIIYQELEKLKKFSILEEEQLRRKLQRMSDHELMNMYWTTVGMIKLELKLQECRTRHEKKFARIFITLSKLHFFTSHWIGNCCVDIFLPQYKLVIEIDGSIHDKIGKMLKDEFRDDFFKSLGIITTHIENHRVPAFIKNLIHGIKTKQIKKLNYRAKRSLMRRTCIETIIRLRPYIGRYYKYVK